MKGFMAGLSVFTEYRSLGVGLETEDVLVRVSVAAIKHHGQKQVGEGKVYVAYTSRLDLHSPSLVEVGTGTQTGLKCQAGADAETMEGCYLLACFPWLAQLAFL